MRKHVINKGCVKTKGASKIQAGLICKKKKKRKEKERGSMKSLARFAHILGWLVGLFY
jgi:hypothetical protein